MGFEVALDEHVYRPAADSLMLATTLEPPSEGPALDVGTGTGLAALQLASEGARVVATDVNPRACRLARRNARANDLTVQPVLTDLADALDARFTAIACNPPYLPAGEPREGPVWRALEAGPEGTALARRFLGELPRLLADEARAWLVTSSHQPEDELQAHAEERGLAWTVQASQSVGRFERLQVVELRRTAGDPPGRHR